MLRRLLSTTNSYPLAIVRLALGIVMFAHGAQKTIGWFGGPGFNGAMGFFAQQGIPPFFAFLAICAEFFGGLGLILGLLSRVAALGILCNMVMAIVMVHGRNGFFMNWSGAKGGEGFEYHVLALAIAWAVMVAGGGALSIDRALTHPRPMDWPPSKDRPAVRPGTSAA
jgi:putative oxidoreductase